MSTPTFHLVVRRIVPPHWVFYILSPPFVVVFAGNQSLEKLLVGYAFRIGSMGTSYVSMVVKDNLMVLNVSS